MATVMSHERIADVRDMRGFDTPAKRAVALALLLQWSAYWAGKNKHIVVLRSPEGDKQLNIPNTSINAHRFNSYVNAFWTYSDKQVWANLVSDDVNLVTADDETKSLVAVLGTSMYQSLAEFYQEKKEAMAASTIESMVEPEVVEQVRAVASNQLDSYTDTPYERVGNPSSAQRGGEPLMGDWFTRTHTDGRVEYVCYAHPAEPMMVESRASIGGHNRIYHRQASPEPITELTTEPVDRGTAFDRTSLDLQRRVAGVEPISERPWLARRGGQSLGKGRMYASGRVMKVTYPDGTDLYRCVGCGALSLVPRSIANHAKVHADLPTGQDGSFEVASYERTDIHHAPSVGMRLRREIRAALEAMDDDFSGLSADVLADTLAEVIVANRPERTEAEPLTAEETLDRIANLVDRGRTASLHEQVETLTTQVVDALGRAERSEGNLQALRELLREDA